MKRNRWLLPAIFLLAIVGGLMFFFTAVRDRNFDEVSGEIAFMQSNKPLDPLTIYDPKNKDTMEIQDTFYSPSYNVNNSAHIIALVNENEQRQHIYEIAIRPGSPSEPNRVLLYTGDNIKLPRIIPGNNAVSFIERGKLCILDIKSKRRTEVTSIGSPYEYDWLTANKLLFHENGSVMIYDVTTENKAVFRENIDAWSLSFNKKHFAYRAPNDISTVHLEHLDSGEKDEITLPDQSILHFRPSPDGNYLLATISSPVGRSDVVIVNAKTLKMRVINPSMLATILDWRE